MYFHFHPDGVNLNRTILHTQLLMNLIKPPTTVDAVSPPPATANSSTNSRATLWQTLFFCRECFFNCFLLIVRIKNNVIRYQSSLLLLLVTIIIPILHREFDDGISSTLRGEEEKKNKKNNFIHLRPSGRDILLSRSWFWRAKRMKIVEKKMMKRENWDWKWRFKAKNKKLTREQESLIFWASKLFSTVKFLLCFN